MLAFFIFLSTLVLLFWRPWNLPIWVFSSLGAFFVFIFQLVDFKDACFVFSLVWDSSLTLVGLIILSFSLEAFSRINLQFVAYRHCFLLHLALWVSVQSFPSLQNH